MTFTALIAQSDDRVEIQLNGKLDSADMPVLRSALQRATQTHPSQLTVRLDGLESICTAALRSLIAAQQSLHPDTRTTLVGASSELDAWIQSAGLSGEVLDPATYLP